MSLKFERSGITEHSFKDKIFDPANAGPQLFWGTWRTIDPSTNEPLTRIVADPVAGSLYSYPMLRALEPEGGWPNLD